MILDGAGDGNRTHVIGLEGRSFTIKLHPLRNFSTKSIRISGILQDVFYIISKGTAVTVLKSGIGESIC